MEMVRTMFQSFETHANAWDLGQLGTGNYTTQPIPVEIALRSYVRLFVDRIVTNKLLRSVFQNATMAALGDQHTLLLMSNGSVYCAGDDTYGQCANLGSGNTFRRIDSVALPTSIAFIAAGRFTSYAIAQTGDVYAWGLARSTDTPVPGAETDLLPFVFAQPNVTTPTMVQFFTSNRTDVGKVVSICAQHGWAAALTDQGRLFSWGDCGQGRLGNSGSCPQFTPLELNFTDILSDERVISFSCGESYGVAWTNHSRLHSWGYSLELDDQLVRSDSYIRAARVDVDVAGWLGSDRLTAMAGNSRSFLIATNNPRKFNITGSQADGLLGNGYISLDSSAYLRLLTPLAATYTDFLASASLYPTQLAVSELWTLLLASDGSIYSAGTNSHGALGRQQVLSRNAPAQVAVGVSGVTDIAVTASATIFLLANGSLASSGAGAGVGCTACAFQQGGVGYNTSPRILQGSLPPVSSVRCGPRHCFASAATGGAVYTWGDDDDTNYTASLSRSQPDSPAAARANAAVPALADSINSSSILAVSAANTCIWRLHANRDLIEYGSCDGADTNGTLRASGVLFFAASPAGVAFINSSTPLALYYHNNDNMSPSLSYDLPSLGASWRVVDLAAGYSHSASFFIIGFVHDTSGDSKVYGAGWNGKFAALGRSGSPGYSPSEILYFGAVPDFQEVDISLAGRSRLVQLAIAGETSFALFSDGKILSWGGSESGLEGRGYTVLSANQVGLVDISSVPSGYRISKIVSGTSHVAALATLPLSPLSLSPLSAPVSDNVPVASPTNSGASPGSGIAVPAPAAEPVRSNRGPDSSALGGGIGGGLALVVLIVGIALFVRYRRRKTREKTEAKPDEEKPIADTEYAKPSENRPKTAEASVPAVTTTAKKKRKVEPDYQAIKVDSTDAIAAVAAAKTPVAAADSDDDSSSSSSSATGAVRMANLEQKALEGFKPEWLIPFADLSFEKKIGQGAFGLVYRGKWRKRTTVAIKQSSFMAVDETELEAFKKEAILMLSIRAHPNIVAVLGVCVHETNVYLIMDYCSKGSLDQALEQQPYTFDQKLKIIEGIASGLLHLHEGGIIHRDMAARNILLAKGMVPKISDFGLSRMVDLFERKGATASKYAI